MKDVNAALEESIDALNLSTRISNILNNNSIDTIRDAAEMAENNDWPSGIGEVSQDEISKQLKRYFKKNKIKDIRQPEVEIDETPAPVASPPPEPPPVVEEPFSMICPKCGYRKEADTDIWCRDCGEEFHPKRCRMCNTPISQTKTLCDVCQEKENERLRQEEIKRRKRKRRVIGIAVTAAALVIGIFGFSSYLSQKDYREELSALNKAIDAQPQASDPYLARGDFYARNNNTVKALEDYTKALELDSHNVAVYVKRAELYIAQNNIDAARADFSRLLDIDDSKQDMLVEKAEQYANGRQYDFALMLYSVVLEKNPENITVLGKRADTYALLGNNGNAIDDYSAILGSEPQNYTVMEKRGDLYFRVGQFAQALADYTQLVELDGFNPGFLLKRANTYFSKADYPAAIVAYKDMVQENAATGAVYKNLGIALLNVEAYDEAIGYFESAITADSANVNVFIQSAEADESAGKPLNALTYYTALINSKPQSSILTSILEKRGDLYAEDWEADLAIADYTALLAIQPGALNIVLKRAEMYAENELWNNAVSDYSTILANSSNNDQVLFERSRAYYWLDQYDNALNDINAALKIDKKNDIYMVFKGLIYLANGQFGKAVGMFDEAVKNGNTDTSTYRGRGRAHYLVGANALLFSSSDFKKAISDFSEGIKQSPEDASLFQYRGAAYHRTEQYNLAVQDYREAIRLDPDLKSKIQPLLDMAQSRRMDKDAVDNLIWRW